ncbi:MAG: hypothetical protein CG437_1448 [Methanosaeta sp. NSP1]|nr:MAG: hypothetical protein CG437_1448 [Methanosaeta sp. NSP1]
MAEGDRRIGCAAAIVRRAVACGRGRIVQLGCEGLAIGAGDGHNLPAGAKGTCKASKQVIEIQTALCIDMCYPSSIIRVIVSCTFVSESVIGCILI